MCGANVSVMHSNFSKYLFQFFKCVNTFSLQGPVIGPTKVLVEALLDYSIFLHDAFCVGTKVFYSILSYELVKLNDIFLAD